MNDYNFFDVYKKKKDLQIDPKSIYFIATIILSICVLLSISVLGRNIYLSSQINNITLENDQIKASVEYIEAEKLQTSLDGMIEYDQIATITLSKFQESNVLGTKILEVISGAIPAGVRIDNFTIDNASAAFSCYTPDRKATAELLLSLKETNLFSDTHIISVSKNEGAGYVAIIECIMKVGEVK
jgi:hypothetical protein